MEVRRPDVSDGTRRAYGPYWNRVLDQWADISLSDRTPTDIQRLSTRPKLLSETFG